MEADYDQAQRIAPQNLWVPLKINKSYQAYSYRAQAYIETKRFDLALEDLRSAYRTEPTKQVRDLITKLSFPGPAQK